MSNFIDNDISLFINNKNKDKFFKDFNDNLKYKKRDFNDNFNNITVSLFTGIENNISICYKFQNDFQDYFQDYFQDKNNKNINDYKSIFVNIKNNIKNNNKSDNDFNNFRNLFNVIFENDNVKNNKIIDFLSNFNDIRD